jgi:hypothetical protein
MLQIPTLFPSSKQAWDIPNKQKILFWVYLLVVLLVYMIVQFLFANKARKKRKQNLQSTPYRYKVQLCDTNFNNSVSKTSPMPKITGHPYIDIVYTVMYFNIAERTFSMKATASSWTVHTNIQVRKPGKETRTWSKIQSLNKYFANLSESPDRGGVTESASPDCSSLRSLCSHQEVSVWTCLAHSVRQCRAAKKHENATTVRWIQRFAI